MKGLKSFLKVKEGFPNEDMPYLRGYGYSRAVGIQPGMSCVEYVKFVKKVPVIIGSWTIKQVAKAEVIDSSARMSTAFCHYTVKVKK